MEQNVLFDGKPWLRFYSEGVPATKEVPNKSVGDMFNEATEKYGNRTAIIFYGTKISYRKLREKVDRLSNALHELGVKKGDTIALLMLNSPEYIISYYAVIKAGAIISAISPVYVSTEIKYQLEDCNCKTIICNDILYPAVEKTGIKLKNVILCNIADSLPSAKRFMGKSILKGVYQKMAIPDPNILRRDNMHSLKKLIKEYPPNTPKVNINPMEDLSALPYTSGTTGMPKGIMTTHYNVIAEAITFSEFFPSIRDGKTFWVGYMPFYHAAGSARTIITGIIKGYTIVILTNPDPDVVLRVISKYKPNSLLGAPSMYEMLKDHKKLRRVNWKLFDIILSGADVLHKSTIDDWKERTGTELHDIYGMTELSGTSHACPKGMPRTGSIGIPTVNTTACILDLDEDIFLPVNAHGELAVAGPQVCKGYWKHPEETKECEAIINNVRWWRTGDIGYMDEDGFFYIYDRKRDIIKYKGYRIHAREVEEALTSKPEIKEAGVIGVPDVKVGEYVKAFVVLQSDARGKISEEDIINYCRDKLAHYKLPKIVELVGEIPKTDVGKVSRRELREEVV